MAALSSISPQTLPQSPRSITVLPELESKKPSCIETPYQIFEEMVKLVNNEKKRITLSHQPDGQTQILLEVTPRRQCKIVDTIHNITYIIIPLIGKIHNRIKIFTVRLFARENVPGSVVKSWNAQALNLKNGKKRPWEFRDDDVNASSKKDEVSTATLKNYLQLLEDSKNRKQIKGYNGPVKGYRIVRNDKLGEIKKKYFNKENLPDAAPSVEPKKSSLATSKLVKVGPKRKLKTRSLTVRAAYPISTELALKTPIPPSPPLAAMPTFTYVPGLGLSQYPYPAFVYMPALTHAPSQPPFYFYGGFVPYPHYR